MRIIVVDQIDFQCNRLQSQVLDRAITYTQECFGLVKAAGEKSHTGRMCKLCIDMLRLGVNLCKSCFEECVQTT